MTPINILRTGITEDYAATALQGRPAVLPRIDAQDWQQAARNPLVRTLFAPLLAQAVRDRDLPLPVLTDELHADYHRTGSRTRFNDAYFLRRRMLSRAAICALLDDKPRQAGWLSILVQHMRAVAEEESWALTAHVGAPSGKDPRVIDLFAAETANLLAELTATFETVLPADLVRAVRTRLRLSLFEPYLNNAGTVGWRTNTHNWNAVCHQGILGAALATEQETQIIARLLVTAKDYLPRFLEGFGADGGCSEGPGYWAYGFGWFTFLNQQLETATRGALSVMDGDDHVHRIALFYPRAAFSNGYAINFADNGPRGYPNPRLLSYLGKRFDEPLLSAFGDEAWRALVRDGLKLEAERCDYFYLARLFLECPAEIPQALPLPGSDFYFRDLQVLAVHRNDTQNNLWEFGAKGGHNDEHHNHNDCGSCLLQVNGWPFVTEIGAPEYHSEYFGPKRYETFAAGTRGHSLPIVNGYEQAAGSEFAAVVLVNDVRPRHVRFAVDLTGCYPAEADCRKLIRTFEYNGAAGTFSVIDEYELSSVGSFESAVITSQSVQQTAQGVLIASGDGQLLLRPADGVRIADTTLHAVRVNPSVNASPVIEIQRIVFQPTELSTHGKVGYLFAVPEASN